MNFRFVVLIFWLSDVLGELCSDVDPSDPNYLLEIPNDCYHFIMCSNRRAFVMACPDGTVFNPYNSICDWPWNARRDCGPATTSRSPTATSSPRSPSPRTPTPTGSPTSRTPTATFSPRPTSRLTTPKPRKCSEVDPSDPNYLIEIPDDCYHFIMCSNRRAFVMACPDGTVFNPYNSICDRPWNVHRKCGPEPSPTGIPTSPKTRSPRTPTPTGSPTSRTPTATFSPRSPSPRTPTPTGTPTSRTPTATFSPRPTFRPTTPKPRKCSEVDPSDPNYLIEIPDDCYHFIMCSNRRAFVMACPDGTVFNPYNSICDRPWNVHKKCGPEPSPTGIPTSPKTRSPRTPTPTGSPTSRTPTATFSPRSPSPRTPTPTGTPTSRTPTATFSPRPTFRPTTPKPRKCSEVDPSDPNYLIEIPDDCYHFIMCSNRRAFVMACPDGTVFNPYNSICDWPWNAQRDCGPTTATSRTPTATSSPRSPSPRTPTPTGSPTSRTPTATSSPRTPSSSWTQPWAWTSTSSF